jgi:hypothetical protein
MVLRIDSSDERDTFIDLLRERIKLDLYLSAKPGHVRLKLSGPRENVKLAIGEIKHIHKLTRDLLYPDKRGFYRYNISFLFHEAGATIRIELLKKLLEHKGYNVDSSDSELIKSDAPLRVMVDLIHSLNSVIEEINALIKPKVVREQIAVLAVLTDVDPFMVLEHALEDGLIRKEKEEDRYSFAVNIDTFLNAFSRSHVEE